ncbi:hypothetical protein MMC08_005647 [Hypocenomyce scalaris]|nr:hypothetical protein [Hypocenomyce scalaris]
MAGGTATSMTNGQHLVVVGLVLQIIIFGFFTIVAFVFNYRQRRAFKQSAIVASPIYQKHLNALYISSGFIMVRSIFRVVEYVQGNDGYIMRHEWFSYVFDGVLMLGVMMILAVVHPSEIGAAKLQGLGLRSGSNDELRTV